jgi:PqqD family protein of HPr-rel-A system
VSPSPRSWQLTDDALVWRQWPGETEVAVFSPRAASIHLLTSAGRALLERLREAPLSDEQVAALVGRETGLPPSELGEFLPGLIQSLRDAELIEPYRP